MKFGILTLSATIATATAIAVPSVTVTDVRQDDASGLVTVSYALSGAPAIVTADIRQGGVSLPAKALGAMAGDIHKKIDVDGSYSFTWRPDREDGSDIVVSDLSFVVDAWTDDAPPDYMVVGLAETNRTFYYATTNAFPGGLLDNPIYRTDMLVLRYIEAKNKTFKMGAWDVERNASLENGARSAEPQYDATLTNDFWIGVFEMTQAQGALINGNGAGSNWMGWPSAFSNVLYRQMRPLENISYNNVRDGNAVANFYPYAPAADSYLGKLRKMTGLPFDLPHDAQWEYACRAGNGVGYWGNGEAMKPVGGTPVEHYSYQANSSANVPGRWAKNGGMKSYTSATSSTVWDNQYELDSEHGSAVCGSYPPNSWGIYDMHGNVFEFVADWVPASASTWSELAGRPNVSFSDPSKQANGDAPTYESNYRNKYYRGLRGGCWQRGASEERSAYRTRQVADGKYGSVGLRVVVNIEP